MTEREHCEAAARELVSMYGETAAGNVYTGVYVDFADLIERERAAARNQALEQVASVIEGDGLTLAVHRERLGRIVRALKVPA